MGTTSFSISIGFLTEEQKKFPASTHFWKATQRSSRIGTQRSVNFIPAEEIPTWNRILSTASYKLKSGSGSFFGSIWVKQLIPFGTNQLLFARTYEEIRSSMAAFGWFPAVTPDPEPIQEFTLIDNTEIFPSQTYFADITNSSGQLISSGKISGSNLINLVNTNVKIEIISEEDITPIELTTEIREVWLGKLDEDGNKILESVEVSVLDLEPVIESDSGTFIMDDERETKNDQDFTTQVKDGETDPLIDETIVSPVIMPTGEIPLTGSRDSKSGLGILALLFVAGG